MSTNKDYLRKKFKEIRKNIINKKEKSNIIFNKIIENEFYKKAKTIGIYVSLDEEVDTFKLIDYSLAHGKCVAVPKIVSDNTLEFYKIDSLDNLVKNKFKILEPNTENKFILKSNEFDLFIVPGICFDMDKNRVGFGKGYYDRFLQNCKAYKLGICFKELVCEEIIDTSAYDVKMDYIVTD